MDVVIEVLLLHEKHSVCALVECHHEVYAMFCCQNILPVCLEVWCQVCTFEEVLFCTCYEFGVCDWLSRRYMPI